MKEFQIRGEYIQLNQLLKVAGWCDSGGMANALIDSGQVKVNGNTELRRRNKVYPGFKVEWEGQQLIVTAQNA